MSMISIVYRPAMRRYICYQLNYLPATAHNCLQQVMKTACTPLVIYFPLSGKPDMTWIQRLIGHNKFG